jgi:hypothetical protein
MGNHKRGKRSGVANRRRINNNPISRVNLSCNAILLAIQQLIQQIQRDVVGEDHQQRYVDSLREMILNLFQGINNPTT